MTLTASATRRVEFDHENPALKCRATLNRSLRDLLTWPVAESLPGQVGDLAYNKCIRVGTRVPARPPYVMERKRTGGTPVPTFRTEPTYIAPSFRAHWMAWRTSSAPESRL